MTDYINSYYRIKIRRIEWGITGIREFLIEIRGRRGYAVMRWEPARGWRVLDKQDISEIELASMVRELTRIMNKVDEKMQDVVPLFGTNYLVLTSS